MQKIKKVIKKILKKVLPNKIVRWLKKIKNPHDEIDFPTDSIRYSKKTAQKVYNAVISGKLHHRFGDNVTLLEKEFAAYHNSSFALATNSGTSTLEMALKAIGVQPGDEVIVPDYTFVATAQAVINRGALPVFADIDDTYTISPKSIEKLISKKTKAIIVVHIFGNVCDMDTIVSLAKKHNLQIIEDACQAVGADYKGRKVGSIGDIGCFSFNVNKAITTGQGGMLLTSNEEYFNIANVTRETGQMNDDAGSDVVTSGNTYAMTEMQAILARDGLKELDSLNKKRRELYEYFIRNFYADYLPLRWHRDLAYSRSSLSRLVFMINFNKLKVSREQFVRDMNDIGLPFKTFYPKQIHTYSFFQNKVDKLTGSTFPFSENTRISYKRTQTPFAKLFCEQMVGINFSPYIQKRQIDELCDGLRKYLLANLK